MSNFLFKKNYTNEIVFKRKKSKNKKVPMANKEVIMICGPSSITHKVDDDDDNDAADDDYDDGNNDDDRCDDYLKTCLFNKHKY